MWSAAVLEAPAVVAGLDDIAMVRDAVEQRGGHLGVTEHGRPFAKGQLGGDDVLDNGQLAVADRGGMAIRRSALSRSVRISWVVRLRCTPVVAASSNAPAMPLRPSPRMASIISCRGIEASHRVVAGAVRHRRMAELEIDDYVEWPVGCRFAVSGTRPLPTNTEVIAVFMLSYIPRSGTPPKKAKPRACASNTISCVPRGKART